jgi:hypothetical protein
LISLLAAGSGNSSSLSNVEPGVLGFLVVAAMGVALVFLLRSMNKQFRKIGPGPEDTDDTTADEAPEGEAGAGAQADGAQQAPAGQDATKSAGRDADATAP